jgi:hypothetical protein
LGAGKTGIEVTLCVGLDGEAIYRQDNGSEGADWMVMAFFPDHPLTSENGGRRCRGEAKAGPLSAPGRI